MKEPSIVFENEYFYIEAKTNGYELQYKRATHIIVAGQGNDLSQVIRTAERMSKYPRNLQKIYG